jgi:hypothetical protein
MVPPIKEIGEAKQGKCKLAARAAAAPLVKHALATDQVHIDAHCVGDGWTVEDEDRLVEIIAIMTMVQAAAHAADIVSALRPATRTSDGAVVSAAQLVVAPARSPRTPAPLRTRPSNNGERALNMRVRNVPIVLHVAASFCAWLHPASEWSGR